MHSSVRTAEGSVCAFSNVGMNRKHIQAIVQCIFVCFFLGSPSLHFASLYILFSEMVFRICNMMLKKLFKERLPHHVVHVEAYVHMCNITFSKHNTNNAVL